jgi:hypothetical protein
MDDNLFEMDIDYLVTNSLQILNQSDHSISVSRTDYQGTAGDPENPTAIPLQQLDPDQ